MLKDKELILMIRNQDNDIIKKLYKQWRPEFVQWIIRKADIDAETAIEIFQQSFIILYENIVSNKLTELSSSLRTYFFSIGMNKIREYKRYNLRFTRDDCSFENSYSMKDEEPQTNYLPTIMEKLDLLGSPCRELLLAFYYQQKKIDEICREMGYNNADTTKTAKYKCLERLRKLCFKEIGKNFDFKSN